MQPKEMQGAAHPGESRMKGLAKMRHLRNPMFNAHDTIGIQRLTKLFVEFSDLSERKFRQNCVP